MKKDIIRQVVVVISFLLMIVLNSLASIPATSPNSIVPLGGKLTGEIADLYKVVFVPAGYVFSIWSIIYVGLIAFTIYHSLPSQRTNPLLRNVGWFAVASNLLNGLWIVLWQFMRLYWTVPVMIALLVVLIIIYLRLKIGKEKATNAQRWLVNVPHSIYLGWISVATIANITDFLYKFNEYQLHWSLLGESMGPFWAIVLLAVGVIIAAVMAFTRKDVAYLAVLVWAFAGIGLKWLSVNQYQPVVIAAFIAAGLVFLLLSYSLFFRLKAKASLN